MTNGQARRNHEPVSGIDHGKHDETPECRTNGAKLVYTPPAVTVGPCAEKEVRGNSKERTDQHCGEHIRSGNVQTVRICAIGNNEGNADIKSDLNPQEGACSQNDLSLIGLQRLYHG